MERLTKRIDIQKENRDVVVFTQGIFDDTIPIEMTSDDIRKVLRKLAEYEDLEEQGLLLRLPCKVGDTVYVIAPNYEKCKHKTECEDYSDEFLISWCKVYCRNGYKGMGTIPTIVKRVEVRETGIYIFTEYGYRNVENFFLTKAEAEQKLKEIEGGNNEK